MSNKEEATSYERMLHVDHRNTKKNETTIPPPQLMSHLSRVHPEREAMFRSLRGRKRLPQKSSPVHLALCLLLPPAPVEAMLDGVLSRPLSRCSLVPRAIGLVDMCDFRYERVIGIRICEHGADG